MGNWVLNIVGGVEAEAEAIAADVVKAATDAGHVIHSIRLTTDEGEKVLDSTNLNAAPVEEPVPPTDATS